MLTVLGGQYRAVPPVVNADLTGKTVVVVGANTGLGFQATKHFAAMNPQKLIMGCRSRQKGEDAVNKIKSETGFKAIELRLIDLASFASVKSFVETIKKDDVRIDILVLNAGVAKFEYSVTEDGWEETLQVNDLSTALLALLLAPRMIETGQKHQTRPRLVVVSSGVHYIHDIDDKVYDAESSFQLLNSKEFCTAAVMENRYFESKLLNMFFVRSLAELLKGSPVVVDTVDPGYCYSDLRRSFSGVRSVIDWLMEKLFAWTSEQGGRQLVYAAVGSAEDPDKLHGAYLDLTEVTEPSDHVLGEDGKRRGDKLWGDLIRELSKVDARIPDIVRTLSS